MIYVGLKTSREVPMGRSEIAVGMYKRVQPVSRTSFFSQSFATPVVNSVSLLTCRSKVRHKKKVKWQGPKEQFGCVAVSQRQKFSTLEYLQVS